ncbi:hypothetical protein ABW19_dt0204517 [Dactylella cylindrospora]|nr:hypothetical protein ABW19_dt0204517 [Dactylella cylindrospora]
MPTWKQKCTTLKLPQTNSTKLKICLPSSRSFKSTFLAFTKPLQNPYFYCWLFLSWITTDPNDGDDIEVKFTPPFSEIYGFLKGETDIAQYIKENAVELLNLPGIGWLFFIGPWLAPDILGPFFESLAYYDDWVEIYKLLKVSLPEIWDLAKRIVVAITELLAVLRTAVISVLLFFSSPLLGIRTSKPQGERTLGTCIEPSQ